MYATPFSVFSQSLDISFYFSCSLSLSYLVFEDSIAASLRLEILSSVVSSLLISSSKIFSIRITAFLIFSISFSFLEFPSQFMLSVLAGCLPIRAFGISVTIVLNSQSDNSNICHIWVWCWYLLCLFKLCVVSFSMSCNFLLKAGYDALGKRNLVLTLVEVSASAPLLQETVILWVCL